MARAVVEDSRRVAARYIEQAVTLREIGWVRAGETFDLFGRSWDCDEVEIICREYLTPERSAGESRRHSLTAVYTTTNVGGGRWYWLCHGCDRRVDHLYRSPVELAMRCRSCLGLGYRSQQIGWHSPSGIVRREGRLLARLDRTRSLRTKEKLLARLRVALEEKERALWRLARSKIALLSRVVVEAEQAARGPASGLGAKAPRRTTEPMLVEN